MNPVDLETAIGARLELSTLSTVQGVGNVTLPAGTKLTHGGKPIVVYQITDMTPDDTFEDNAAEIRFFVSIFDHRNNPSSAWRAVYDLVYGDSSGTDNAPTVGLHRWKATGMASIEDAVISAGPGRALHELEAWHWQTDFIIRNAQEK